MASPTTAPPAPPSPAAQAKLKTIEELAEVAALARTRGETVVLAHGTFDLMHIGHLRRKIEPDPHHPTLIKTVHGAGYIFTPSVEKG